MRIIGALSGFLFFWVTVWSASRFVAARDSVAEVSAGVWWIGGMMFCGALLAVAIAGTRGAGQERGKS